MFSCEKFSYAKFLIEENVLKFGPLSNVLVHGFIWIQNHGFSCVDAKYGWS